MHNGANLWDRIENRLATDMPQWRERVEDLGQVSAVRERAIGRRWSDEEMFKGLIHSVLSNNTDWAKVKSIIPELPSLFHGFRLHEHASLNAADIGQRFIPWFAERRAGSVSLGRDLTNTIHSVRRLLELKAKYGSLECYVAELLQEKKGDVISVALALGRVSSPHKLPGLRVPLAAEFLKNIGFDVAKPDRHINRATGCFGWVQFRNWPDRNGTKQPTASESEMVQVMRAMAAFAGGLGQLVCFLDNAVWLLCAKSGLHLGNRALCALAGNDAAVPRPLAQQVVLTRENHSAGQRNHTGSTAASESGERSGHLSIPERVKAICEELGAGGRIIKKADIVLRAASMGMNPTSVLPADYCSNTRTGQWSVHSFLHAVGPGRYVLSRFATSDKR